MTKEEREVKRVQKYLDTLIKTAEKARKLSLNPCKLNDKKELAPISLFSQGAGNVFSIHIYSGLQRVATILNLPVEIRDDIYETEVELRVMYNGCRLFQIGYDNEKWDA